MAALGTTDELNSALGLANEFCIESGNGLDTFIGKVQFRLLDAGANIATPRSDANEKMLQRTQFDPENELVKEMELEIDRLDQQLSPLRNFILPSGGKASASLHMARSICRRAERRVVPLVQEQQADKQVAVYLNRLSDYLFTAARFAAMKENKQESLYLPRKKKDDGM